jgi:hypothetical protein
MEISMIPEAVFYYMVFIVTAQFAFNLFRTGEIILSLIMADIAIVCLIIGTYYFYVFFVKSSEKVK